MAKRIPVIYLGGTYEPFETYLKEDNKTITITDFTTEVEEPETEEEREARLAEYDQAFNSFMGMQDLSWPVVRRIK